MKRKGYGILRVDEEDGCWYRWLGWVRFVDGCVSTRVSRTFIEITEEAFCG
jgi:hypothetical protein